jgi:hypothetical protein
MFLGSADTLAHIFRSISERNPGSLLAGIFPHPGTWIFVYGAKECPANAVLHQCPPSAEFSWPFFF